MNNIEQLLNEDNSLDFLHNNSHELCDSIKENNIHCQFYSEKTFVENFSSLNNFLSISLNVQSLSAKFQSLCNWISMLNVNNIYPDIISMQEVWAIQSHFFDIQGYKLFTRLRESGRGGGVGMYVKNCYNVTELSSTDIFVDKVFESKALSIDIQQSKKIIVVSLYRPPSSPFDEFVSYFVELLERLSSFNLPVYIYTDINVDLLKVQIEQNSSSLLDLTLSYGYLQLISKATRIQGSARTLIDHIYCTDNVQDSKTGVITDSMSDHFITFHSTNFEKKRQEKVDLTYRSFSATNISIFRENLKNVDWNGVLQSECPNVAYDRFWDLFATVFDLCFPLKKRKFNKNRMPCNSFMTRGLLISRRTNMKLAKLAKLKPTEINKIRYTKYRNIYNSLIRKSKRKDIEDELQRAGSNSKKKCGRLLMKLATLSQVNVLKSIPLL